MNVKKSKIISDKSDLLNINNDFEWTESNGDLSVTATVAMPKKSNKKFFNDLDSFFESAIDDLWKESQVSDSKDYAFEKTDTKTERKAGKKSFFSGLDALFSNTSPAEGSHNDEPALSNEEHLKRVTFLFKKDKLEVLKNMAKKEKLYLRDIISKVLDQYLEEKGISSNQNS